MNWKRIGAATLFVLATVLLGFMAGGFLGGRVFGGGGMGWDRLADALGGAFLGIMGGLIVSGALLSRLTTKQLLVYTLGAVALTAVMVLIFRMFPANPVGALAPLSLSTTRLI